MTGVRAATGMSKHRVCRMLGHLARPMQRYAARRREDEVPLLKRIYGLVRAHPRWEYRMTWARFASKGWSVNAKWVQRLWRLEGLKVSGIQRKKHRTGSSSEGVGRKRAVFPNDVWPIDFSHDRGDLGRAASG